MGLAWSGVNIAFLIKDKIRHQDKINPPIAVFHFFAFLHCRRISSLMGKYGFNYKVSYQTKDRSSETTLRSCLIFLNYVCNNDGITPLIST